MNQDSVPIGQAFETDLLHAPDKEDVDPFLEQSVRLLALASEMMSFQDARAIARHVVETLSRELPLQAVSVLVFDEVSGQLHYLADYGVSEEIKRMGFREDGLTLRVFRTGEPLFVENASQDALTHPQIRSLFPSFGCLPIQHHGDRLGVLIINYDSPHVFFPLEREILRVFASQLAIAFKFAQQGTQHVRQAGSLVMELNRAKVRFLEKIMDLEPWNEENPTRLYQRFIQRLMDILGERKQTQEELRRLSTAISQASDSILVTDPRGTILYANPSLCTLTGIPLQQLEGEGLKGVPLEGSPSPSDERNRSLADLADEVFSRGESEFYQLHGRRPNGDYYQAAATLSPVRDANGSISHMAIGLRDITREETLSAQLRHSQRLEAVGILASGLAHDFNNILTPIRGYAEMMLLKPETPESLKSPIEAIALASRRASDLIRQILAFSRPGEDGQQWISPEPLIQETIHLLRAGLPSQIRIHQRLNGDGYQVYGASSQFHQLVMNLCTNAFKAMEAKGGLLELLLDPIHLSSPLVLTNNSMDPGIYLRLIVKDDGCGMDSETLARIFLPFFTTRPEREGTGLGLAIVHSIVNTMKGGISVQSQLGRGTEFTIFLPARKEQITQIASSNEEFTRGEGRILIVDDEVEVRNLLRDALEMFGFTVENASDPMECLRILEDEPEGFDLCLTDFTMPRMNGLELATLLRERHPKLPVILMTGQSQDVTARTPGQKTPSGVTESAICAILEKPLSIHHLLKVLQEHLGRKGHPQGDCM